MRPSRQSEYCEFVDANLASLRRFGYLVCGDWHRAEDAVQTVLVKLYTDWNKAQRRSLPAYSRRMVVNALHDIHRRSWFRRERSIPEPPDTPARSDDSSDERIVLMTALGRLPTRQRATLVLRFWEDRPVEETARIMDCSESTVKSQTAKALNSLRDLLPDYSGQRTERVTS